MIRLTDRLPELTEPDAVGFKLHALFECYADTALFWTQESRDTCFGLLDGHLILSAKQPVDQELRHFVSFLSPKSIFTHPETLASLGLTATETVFVLAAKGTPGEVLSADTVSSREVYELLSVEGLSLPDYPSFAVDYCRKINHGLASVFAQKGRGAAVTLLHGNYALLNGLASHQKGFGSLAVQHILHENATKTVLVCCRAPLCKFYKKNGFSPVGQAVYQVK